MRISPETGFIGVWSKQTLLFGVVGGWGRECWGDGVTEPFSPFVLFTSDPNTRHSTLYASKVELTLYTTLFG